MKLLGSRTLTTKRLVLKAQTMEEQYYLWSVLMQPEVNKLYLSISKKYADKLHDWSKQKEFYQCEIEHANDLDVFKWSVFLKDTNICIGRVSCHETSSGDLSIRDVGWYIDPKYQGQGYGFEAAKAMVDYMFCECKIDKIITSAAIENPASWKIMEKLGFKRLDETKMVEYTFLDNLVEDYQYLLTKEMYFNK